MSDQDNVINIEDSPEMVKKQPSLSEIEVVKNILSAAGMTNYEPAVLNQLLYMTYSKFTTYWDINVYIYIYTGILIYNIYIL